MNDAAYVSIIDCMQPILKKDRLFSFLIAFSVHHNRCYRDFWLVSFIIEVLPFPSSGNALALKRIISMAVLKKKSQLVIFPLIFGF